MKPGHVAFHHSSWHNFTLEHVTLQLGLCLTLLFWPAVFLTAPLAGGSLQGPELPVEPVLNIHHCISLKNSMTVELFFPRPMELQIAMCRVKLLLFIGAVPLSVLSRSVSRACVCCCRVCFYNEPMEIPKSPEESTVLKCHSMGLE